jgi:CDP-2,3-bis-(O-geranylgeranyl)-sn-glycerol synthase
VDKETIFALWFFIPAAIANMAPVFAAQLPGLRKFEAPLDFGMSLGGKRVFGAHKTWRGLVSGMVAATAVLWLQQYLARYYGWFTSSAQHVHYLALPLFLLGPAFAVGALGGDAVKSFVKRRRDIPSGGVWLPYDLIDHIIGAALLALPFVAFDWWTYVVVVTVWFVGNFGISFLGYLLHIKKRPW